VGFEPTTPGLKVRSGASAGIRQHPSGYLSAPFPPPFRPPTVAASRPGCCQRCCQTTGSQIGFSLIPLGTSPTHFGWTKKRADNKRLRCGEAPKKP